MISSPIMRTYAPAANRWLLLILFIATVLRLINLSSGDPLGDEVLYGFRAIGMLDYDNAEFQTTPLEWSETQTNADKGSAGSAFSQRKSAGLPWWTRLSFHDHPPLVFLLQNLSMAVFGESVWGFRLPSAILGILSVYLLYLIGRRMFSESIGLLAAALTAVTVNHVFISRIGLQESAVIFFILLATNFFLKALDTTLARQSGKPPHQTSFYRIPELFWWGGKNFLWTGVALGLGFLTKYSAFILMPIFLTYLALFRREVFKNKFFWLGVLVSLAVFSPVIIYNVGLYLSAGHFDFQFSYLFGQNPDVWKIAPGKEEIGSLFDRFKNFIPNLLSGNSWIFLFSAALGFYAARKNKFLIIVLFYLAAFLLLVGPTLRFLSVLTPFLALVAANFLEFLRQRRWSYIGLAVLLGWEVFYSVNSQILDYPFGKEFWFFSAVRFENYNWGYDELGKFLNQELTGRTPAFSFIPRYKFLEKVQENKLEAARRRGLSSFPALIVYDGNILNTPQLWFLDRLQIYHGWPVLKTEEYQTFLQKFGQDYFLKLGVKQYFIALGEKIPKRKRGLSEAGRLFEQELLRQGIFPLALYNKKGEEAFRVYSFKKVL